ncbi:MAG: hypothetical protein JO257_16190 [Deltaproteobacteria bacterium]|nr:hypothetical protein [Deltaproteobacteria bacterium]
MTDKDPKPHHLLVAILTTAGAYPADGFNEEPENQPIKVELEKAAKVLKLTNTATWIAKVGDTELDIEKSYASYHLSGKVEINYGPRETGGGASAS